MPRADPHCLTNFDPADYEYDSSMPIVEIPTFDAQFLIALGDRTCELLIESRDALAEKRAFWMQRIDREGFQQGNFINRRTCDHCGAWFKWGECYHHIPTGQLIVVGWQCAENRFGKDWGAEDVHEIRKQIQGIENYGQKARRIRALLNSHEGLETALQYDAHQIVRSIKTSLLTYGKLSDKQIKTVFKAVEGKWVDKPPTEFEEEPKPLEPLESGKRVCEGIVLAMKLKDTLYGRTWKMLLKLDCGNKLWGTIAKNLIDEADIEEVSLKGCKVRFVAIVKAQSENFGYFSRPKEAEIVDLPTERKSEDD